MQVQSDYDKVIQRIAVLASSEMSAYLLKVSKLQVENENLKMRISALEEEKQKMLKEMGEKIKNKK